MADIDIKQEAKSARSDIPSTSLAIITPPSTNNNFEHITCERKINALKLSHNTELKKIEENHKNEVDQLRNFIETTKQNHLVEVNALNQLQLC